MAVDVQNAEIEPYDTKLPLEKDEDEDDFNPIPFLVKIVDESDE